MGSHLLVAAIFVLTALPAFVFARWLAQGRLPLAGGSGMTVRAKAVLDAKLARLMRMIGLAMLAAGAAMAAWGDDDARVVALLVVLTVAVNGLVVACVVTVVRSGRAARGDR